MMVFPKQSQLEQAARSSARRTAQRNAEKRMIREAMGEPDAQPRHRPTTEARGGVRKCVECRKRFYGLPGRDLCCPCALKRLPEPTSTVAHPLITPQRFTSLRSKHRGGA